jgi:hypothetical protein
LDPLNEQIWMETSMELPGFIRGLQKIQMKFK